MILSREIMLEIMATSDRSYNGKFLVGVMTTGIYCLPSCPARMPKHENIQFFSSELEAQSKGLRACKRCRPSDFYQNFDPVLDTMKQTVAKIRLNPGDFPGVPQISQVSGIGLTKLNQLFRRHYHLTPGVFLNRVKIDKACEELSTTGSSVLEISNNVGFESLSAFNENFLKLTGMTPAKYRNLGASNHIKMQLPPDFRPEFFLSLQERDKEGVMERVVGQKITKALAINPSGVLLHAELKGNEILCQVEGEATKEEYRKLHGIVVRMLGLAQDPAPFERRCEEQGVAQLLESRHGMRIPQSAEPFEGLVWAIVGQQVTVIFATQLRRALAELCGLRIGSFIAHPTAKQIANLEYEELLPLKFSRRKAEYLIDTARMIVSDELPFEDYSNYPATDVEQRLLAVRGLGVWSVNYLMLRAFGFADCTPLGDTGLRSAIHRFYCLETQPSPEIVAKYMEPFAPYRSLATYHFWHSRSSIAKVEEKTHD